MNRDEYWMTRALALAGEAAQQGEVPVGAVLVQDGEMIGQGHNAPIGLDDPTAHAEILAIREAARLRANYRLPGSTLYVTLEPCPMCAGAIVHARVERVVFGAFDDQAGAAGSVTDLLGSRRFNHQCRVEGGILREACARLLVEFFGARRAQTRARV